MRKAYKLQDLCCANCASKIECDINKLDGVNKATVTFMTQKLLLDADETNFDSIVNEAQRICSKYEPDCTIVR